MSETRKIFGHTDPGGDWVRVESWADGRSLTVTTGVESRPVLDVEQASALHAALGSWLAEHDGEQASPAPLTPADVRAIVTEHVASVMPLYLAPFGALVKDPEDDPEPGDVGHPRPHSECTCHDDEGNSIRRIAERSKYEDAGTVHSVNDRASAGAPVMGTWDDKLWGTAGTPPGAPDCAEYGCSHEYARHVAGLGCCTYGCSCTRYRSTR